MVFCVCVAADTFGKKHNVRLEFPACPVMTTLVNAIESQYDIIARSHRPQGCPEVPFHIYAMQVYDDTLLRWTDLASTAQLRPECQIYVFQSESVWAVDVQGTIPVARNVISWVSPEGTPIGGSGVIPTVRAVTLEAPQSSSQKALTLFRILDPEGRGFVRYMDLKGLIERVQMELIGVTPADIFNTADRRKIGEVNYEDWIRLSLDYPEFLDALYYRSLDPTRSVLNRVPGAPTTTTTHRLTQEATVQAMYEELRREHDAAQRASVEARRAADLAMQREATLYDKMLLLNRGGSK
eukprot:PhF_6_TR38934/c0_g1_i1/m.58251